MKKIYSALILSSLISTGAFAQENLHLHSDTVVDEDTTEKVLPQDAVKVPYVPSKALIKKDIPESNMQENTKDEKVDEKPLEASFKLKQDFIQDNKSVSAFKEIDKLNEVLGAKDTAWFNPLPNDKDFTIVYKQLSDEDSEKILKTEDYKDYRFAIMSFYYQDKKQGDQLSILLPSKYEGAVRIEKYGSSENSINTDLMVDSKGRLVSILGPNEAIYLKKKEFRPIEATKTKGSNIILY
jgi:hypothetical protein